MGPGQPSTSILLYLSEFSTIFLSLPGVIQDTSMTRDMMVSRSKKSFEIFSKKKLTVKNQ